MSYINDRPDKHKLLKSKKSTPSKNVFKKYAIITSIAAVLFGLLTLLVILSKAYAIAIPIYIAFWIAYILAIILEFKFIHQIRHTQYWAISSRIFAIYFSFLLQILFFPYAKSNLIFYITIFVQIIYISLLFWINIGMSKNENATRFTLRRWKTIVKHEQLEIITGIKNDSNWNTIKPSFQFPTTAFVIFSVSIFISNSINIFYNLPLFAIYIVSSAIIYPYLLSFNELVNIYSKICRIHTIENELQKPILYMEHLSLPENKDMYAETIKKYMEIYNATYSIIRDYHAQNGIEEKKCTISKYLSKNGDLIWQYYIDYFGGIEGLKEYLGIE